MPWDHRFPTKQNSIISEWSEKEKKEKKALMKYSSFLCIIKRNLSYETLKIFILCGVSIVIE